MKAMLEVDEAIEQLVSAITPMTSVETVALENALGRVLAESPIAKVDVPPADNSAMDGYAVCLKDLDGAEVTSAAPVLSISQRIPAGVAPENLVAGACARIFTGAEIPQGADTVIMQENASVTDAGVAFNVIPNEAGANIRCAGQDIAKGTQVITKGSRLEPADLGVLASVGLAKVVVYKQPMVAILSTGDELVEPGQPLAKGQIYNSNRYLLKGLLNSLGVNTIDVGCVEDTQPATEAALIKATQADMIISTGGVSVGEEDHVKAAVDALGQLDMWKVKLKPGKPIAFGHVQDVPFIGLPGNPASALITFCLFANPCIQKLKGMQINTPLQLSVPAGFTRIKENSRQEYLRVRVENGELIVHNNQSSGVLSSASWAHGLAVIPPNTLVNKGDPIGFVPFSELLH